MVFIGLAGDLFDEQSIKFRVALYGNTPSWLETLMIFKVKCSRKRSLKIF